MNKQICGLLTFLSLSLPALSQTGPVSVNRVPLTQQTLMALQQYGIVLPSGSYWYDPQCGAWGLEGSGTQGFTTPGLPLGGPLPGDISGGNTGYFINGRHLPYSDLQALMQITGPFAPGYYWLDSQGNAGQVGGPALVNLRSAGLYRQGGGVGENYSNGGGAYHNSRTGIGVITDGAGGAAVFTR